MLSKMCEVTEKNFEEIYPTIVDDLHDATFISIDCEFSGLFDDEFLYSFFDSPKSRFQKLQNCLETVKIIQFGLSTFKYETTSNTFSVASYTFYIKPSAIIKKQKLTYQMGSLEFLCKNNFNFNKLFYDGISYLNKSHEKIALKMIEDQTLISFDIKEDIQKYCSQIAQWNASATEDSEILLEVSESKMFVYILHGEIRKQFPSLWTFFSENNSIRIKKLKKSDRSTMSEDVLLLKKKLFDSILGFTRIIKEIEDLKKPIIGHNLLIDLILIYKQFYNPSPVSYKSFKKDITKIFPIIYDTKLISLKLRQILPKDTLWNMNSLPTLYSYLRNGKGSTIVIFTPMVHHRNEEFAENGHLHDAGFDSYITGYCFIKMAHIFSLWDEKKQSFLRTSLLTSSKWLLGAVSGMKNQLNMTRAKTRFIVLDGDDPDNFQPFLLYIRSRTKQPLDVSEIEEILAKNTPTDIQLLSEYSGLLASGYKHQLEDIRDRFKNHKKYQVSQYNYLKHSKSGRIVSGTVILSVFLITIFISKSWHRVSLPF